jgi:hypothetical protein
MQTKRSALLVGLGIAAAAIACSSSSNDSASTPRGADAGADGAADGGGASGYAAFKPDVGQLRMNGGPLVTSPKIVTVTWSVDPNAAAIDSFGDKLGASAHWTSTVGEYGIGAATSGPTNHVHVATAPPATSTTEELEAWFVSQVSNTAASGWPAYDASTIYVIYVPPATQLMPSGPYHSETAVGANAHVPFVVIDENAHGTASVLDALTAAASHEIAETATNPRVLSSGSDLGLVDFDAPHIAWQISTGDAELGDLCEGRADSTVKGPADFPVTLQRLWSNKSAAAGHDPCVPAGTAPYYNVTPLDLETVSVFVDTDQSASSGLGYKIAIGAKKTLKVGFYSDAPVPGPWTISAVEGNYFSPASNHRLTVAVTKGTGTNGDIGTIDVTANEQSLGAGNAVLMTVTSQAPGLPPHSVPILIGTY